MENKKDYLELLEIYVQIVEANKGVASIGDDRIPDAEGLALKFFGHAISVYYLFVGINIPEHGLRISDFVDSPSINVVGRAAIETFLLSTTSSRNPKRITLRTSGILFGN